LDTSTGDAPADAGGDVSADADAARWCVRFADAARGFCADFDDDRPFVTDGWSAANELGDAGAFDFSTLNVSPPRAARIRFGATDAGCAGVNMTRTVSKSAGGHVHAEAELYIDSSIAGLRAALLALGFGTRCYLNVVVDPANSVVWEVAYPPDAGDVNVVHSL